MEDARKQFMQEIKTLCEPAIVVATDQQITDLLRFCTYEGKFGITTIDPTFSPYGNSQIVISHILLHDGQSSIFA